MENMQNDKLVSIIITNYNGKEHLQELIPSLFDQDYKNVEIIVVDNNSSDNSVQYVNTHFPYAKVIQNSKNFGYAKGNNIGLSKANGSFILVMNNDVLVTKNFLTELIKSFDKIPNLGVVQPKILLMNDRNKLDECGAFWTDTGFIYHYGIYKNANLEKYNRNFPVYSVKGVCILIKREVIEKIDMFDEDFWCYFEETDFCHRVWLTGYECWYNPASVIYHKMGGTALTIDNSYIQFHSFKNRLCSYIKNLQTGELIKIIPVYLSICIVISFAYLAKRKSKHFFMIYRAMSWNIKNRKSTVKKRRYIQRVIRKVNDKAIFRKVRKNPRLSYYRYLLKGLEGYDD